MDQLLNLNHWEDDFIMTYQHSKSLEATHKDCIKSRLYKKNILIQSFYVVAMPCSLDTSFEKKHSMKSLVLLDIFFCDYL